MSQDHLITLVDKATSEYLIQTDWTVNMQICDTLNREGNPMLCRDVVRHTTKRMKEKKSRVSMLALELLETLVKNCEVTHSFVGGNEVQAEIIKLIQNKKTKEPVKERALELVQYWADSFSSRRDLPQFNQTFMLLRRAGIPFPPRRKDEPPLVFKNAPAASAAPQRSSTQIPSNNRSESGSNLKGDLGSVQENVNLAMEMLAYTNPEEEDPAANEILKELIATCKEAMPNVRSTIESANFSSDAQMVSMLALNDELVKVQEMYEDLLARRQLFVTHGPQKKAAPQNDILDLATAFGTLNTQAPPLNPPTYQTATTTPSRPLDEFDFLSGPAPPQQNITPTKATPYPPLPAQSQPVNPFFDSSAPVKPSGGDLDEFDLFARGRHSTSTPPPAMSSPLQPSKQVQSTSLYFPPSTTSPTPMYSNTSSNPYNLTPAITTTASNPYNITPAANPYNSAPLATSPANQLYGNNNAVPRATSPYNMNTTIAPTNNPYNSAPLATSPNNQLYGNNNAVPRATSPYNMNTAIAPTTNPYNSAPLATSPANQLYGNNNAVPRATSPYNNPQAYGLNPTSSGGAVGAPFQSSYPQGNYGQQSLQPMQPMQSMQPMQPMQSMQPMQPLQPSYNSNPYGQPMGQNPYSLPAGGYRPQ